MYVTFQSIQDVLFSSWHYDVRNIYSSSAQRVPQTPHLEQLWAVKTIFRLFFPLAWLHCCRKPGVTSDSAFFLFLFALERQLVETQLSPQITVETHQYLDVSFSLLTGLDISDSSFNKQI